MIILLALTYYFAMDLDSLQQMRERLLLCTVCMEEYKDPRILPCHHSLCLKCIGHIVASTGGGSSFNCPHCRSEICIPQGGIKNLPVNFYIVSLQDELGTSDYKICQICSRANIASQFHCVDCAVNICRLCIASHRLEEHCDNPNIVRLSSFVSSPHLSPSLFCDNHSEKLQLFCHTCRRAICITCSCTDHKRHNLKPLSEQLQESVQESKLFMQKELDRLILEQQQAHKSKTLMEDIKENVVSSSNETLMMLETDAHKACETIVKRKSEIEEEIKCSMETQVVCINHVMTKLQKYTDLIEKGQDFLSNLQESDICMEAIDSYKKYLKYVKEMRDQYTSSFFKIQHSNFIPSNDLKVIDLNLGILKKTFVFGQLGSLRSKEDTIFVDSENLEFTSEPKGLLKLIYSGARISLLIVCFALFTHLSDFIDVIEPFQNLFRYLSVVTHDLFEGFFTPE